MQTCDQEEPAVLGGTARDRFHARTVSRRTAFILVFAIGMPLGHGVAPWAISRLSPRYGWETSGPGLWNLVGLIPLALGIAGLVWIVRAAFVQTPGRIELRENAFLLTSGPYAHSRNPMYISELALWLGWALFYGRVGVLIGSGVSVVVLVLAVRYEERVLDARSGNVYLEYKRKVPRWLRTRRPNRDASS